MGFMNFLDKYEKKIDILIEQPKIIEEKITKVKHTVTKKKEIKEDKHVCTCKYCGKTLSEKNNIHSYAANILDGVRDDGSITINTNIQVPKVEAVPTIIKSHAASILDGVEETNTEARPMLPNENVILDQASVQQNILTPEMAEQIMKNGRGSETANHASLLV
jgi:hypothetical protein